MANKKIIAVLSGKGGTGKTLVSVNLAASVKNALYVDCDVEAPNGHLFLKPELNKQEDVNVLLPFSNPAKCNGCRVCVDFCKFNALVYIKDQWKVFEDVCHSCGGCMLLCPQQAITEVPHTVGSIEQGLSEDIQIISGILNIGEESGSPIIQKLLGYIEESERSHVFIDCPPGSACIVMESIKDADYCVLVAEPTRFGVHNLEMVYRLVKLFDKPYGVIINKYTEEDDPVQKFCTENNIPILGRIPFSQEIGTMNSNGSIVARESDNYADLFATLLETIEREARL